jgi:phosphoenolpyruvate-protein kinase (PTS system EI component)
MARPIEGEPLSPGVARGCLVLFTPDTQPIWPVSTEGVDRELLQFRARVAHLLERLDHDSEQLRREGMTAEAQIPETHVFLLRDRAPLRRLTRSGSTTPVGIGRAVHDRGPVPGAVL